MSNQESNYNGMAEDDIKYLRDRLADITAKLDKILALQTDNFDVPEETRDAYLTKIAHMLASGKIPNSAQEFLRSVYRSGTERRLLTKKQMRAVDKIEREDQGKGYRDDDDDDAYWCD